MEDLWERRKNDESPDPRSAKTAGLTVQYQAGSSGAFAPLRDYLEPVFAAGDAEGKGVEIVEEVHILHDDLFRHVDSGPPRNSGYRIRPLRPDGRPRAARVPAAW